ILSDFPTVCRSSRQLRREARSQETTTSTAIQAWRACRHLTTYWRAQKAVTLEGLGSCAYYCVAGFLVEGSTLVRAGCVRGRAGFLVQRGSGQRNVRDGRLVVK